jgi:hypothetical protein
MLTKVDVAVKKAETLLKQNKYDAAHDINHHNRVWEIARDIAVNIYSNIDIDILRIACMWHDVLLKEHEGDIKNHAGITNATAIYLRRYMEELGFNKRQAKMAYLAVKHHELSDKPINIEGEILYDADKLDAFTPERSIWFARSRRGKTSLWSLKLILLRSSLIRYFIKRKFHFEYSRKLFDERVNNLLKSPGKGRKK